MAAGKIMLVQKAKSYSLKNKKSHRPKPSKGVSTAVKKYVNRSLNKTIENKFDYNTATSDISNQLASSPYFQPLNWQTTQGTGQGNRIGNRLTVKNAVLTGSLNMKDYNAYSNSRQLDQLVTIVVFKLRTYLAGTNPTYSNTFSKMFQMGNSSAPLANTPLDHIRKFNKDIFQIKAVRRFKMGYSGAIINGASGTGTQPVPNNDFNYQRFFKIPLTKFYKKTQIFDEGGAVDARNDNLFFMVYCAPADGSVFTSTPLSLTWDWEAQFEDA